MRIDVAIPADGNVIQKEAEKKLKYRSSCIEIQQMWDMKCMIIPVVIGATWNSNSRFKEEFGSHTRKTTRYSYTWNITRHTESAAVRNLKPEQWGSPLVQQEKY
jgi:hypothetical protein